MTSRRRAQPALPLFAGSTERNGGGMGRGFESRLGDVKSRVRIPFGAPVPVSPLCGAGARPGSGGARSRAGSVAVPVLSVCRCGCSGAGGRQGGTELRGSGAGAGTAGTGRSSRDAGTEKCVFI